MRIQLIQDIIDILRGKKKILKQKFKKKTNIKKDKKRVQELIKSNQKIKLNLGCGFDYKDGWVNIDNNFYGTDLKLDFNWDLSQPMLFPDKSVDFIFNEHFLEHLRYEEGFKFLSECKRILKEDGILRIAMPDLAQVIDYYTNPNWRELLEKSLEDAISPEWNEEQKKAFLKQRLNVETRAQVLNISFREYDDSHKWLYDIEEISRLVKEVGFTKIKRCNSEESEHIELQNIETRKLGSSLVVEVQK